LEEVVQSTYVTAWERMAEYSGGGRLDSWLKGIALNRIRGEARHRRRMTGGDRIAELIQPEEPDTGPDDEVQRLAECLERLGPQARRLLECRYRDGMALTDLARRFRRTAGALAVALHRLRHGLRQCLGRA
jgi:RNA polymerase sigma-70 factor (ECF subfamily)